MAEYDLTSRVCAFFDRHLVFPLLEFLSYRHIYAEEELAETKLELLRNTNMVDFLMEVHHSLFNSEPAELLTKRNDVVDQLKTMHTLTEPIVAMLEDSKVADFIKSSRDGRQLLDFLKENYDFKEDMLDTLYRFAKFQYECGNYSAASEYLYYYRLLVPPGHANYLNALWGKFGSEILLQNWEVAKDDLTKLKAFIDNNPFDTDLEQLQQRAWLIHWSLFVFFNHPKGRDDIIEMCLNNQNYLNTIQVLCPHLLRYLAVAVVTTKKRKQSLKDFVKIISLESPNYRDPVTEFLECLFVNYDFDGAQEKLKKCEDVLQNDFFLTACLDEFIESARLLIFEMFCRIHQCISINMLAAKLNMAEDEAERWIVNLIRNAQLDAKIDSKLGHVVMGTKTTSIHEQVMENTKRLSFRSQQMAFQLEKIRDEKRTERLGATRYD